MLDTHIGELVQLWEGERGILERHRQLYPTGQRLDIQLRGRFCRGGTTWDRVLVAIEDVTEREMARRKLALSEEYAQGLFEHSPISLWVEDFSAIRKLLDEARQQGIRDFRVFTDVHPEFVDRCMSEIRVIDVNQHTLDLFHAPDNRRFFVACGKSSGTTCARIFASSSSISGTGRSFSSGKC